MQLQRWICLSGFLLATSIGCSSMQCASCNPCDPCGQVMSGGCNCGCGVKGWWQQRKERLRNNFSWFNDCSCGGCSVCGGDNCGMSGGTCGMPSTGGGASCGCGQSHGYSPAAVPTEQYAAPVPPNDPPAPIPSTGTQRSGEPIPAPASTPATTFQQPASGQIQHVTMEEFQRLPGTVISGPNQSSVPTMSQPNMVPPALSNASIPPRPINAVQQAQWVPAR